MTTEKKLPAPAYVSFGTFRNFLDWLGEVGVPSRIDRSFWGQKFSGAAGAQLVATLRFFGLIDENGVPDPALETMAKDVEQRKVTLRSLMKRYDPALDGLDLERATAGELDERFRRYSITGATFGRAIAFFVQAAQYSGIPLSPYITQRRRTAKGNGASVQPRRRGRQPKAKPEGEKPEPQVIRPTSIVDSLGLHPTVTPLLQDLNRIGSNWDKADRDKWIATFLAVLDYAYPTVLAKGKEASGEK
jgi:hypothetical protein